ncbi:conserved putative membrane protein [Candidatus Protochlamydia naegleriophila]|uniref:Conserved putative membrane protein n=1 Tax=Candidatus Protochlamydia naegleriophila TaxID=389348 RepID=A0A0U5JE82_9BACT|nr:hypothetical protein [Candidatus Protochlamydia naegleriophila]CUI16898.1 conserved putative membrane protein [Candidatus Protochlamydia naegleriophila]
MIEAIRYYGNHTILDNLTEVVSAVVSTFRNALDQRIYSFVVEIIFQIIVSSLFYFNRNLFSLGFVIGFIFDRQVREIVEKVNIVYNAQRSFVENALFFGGGVLLAFFTIPNSIAIATLYHSAQWGAFLYTSSREQ